MTQTVYTINTGRTVYQTDDAHSAEVAARMGHRVTARTEA